MAAAIHPVGPNPILALYGQTGAAKSTLAKVIRLLIDPQADPLLAEPRNTRDLMVTAVNRWLRAYDNEEIRGASSHSDWIGPTPKRKWRHAQTHARSGVVASTRHLSKVATCAKLMLPRRRSPMSPFWPSSGLCARSSPSAFTFERERSASVGAK